MSVGTVFEIGITTLTDVTPLSLLAYDIRDMDDHIQKGNILEAKRIYDEGKNWKRYDSDGEELETRNSLKSLGRAGYSPPNNSGSNGNEASYQGVYDEDPYFIFQMLGMMNANANQDMHLCSTSSSNGNGLPPYALYAPYADEFITRQLNDDSILPSQNLAAEASVLLTIQMYASHQLWEGVLGCSQISNGYNPLADKTGRYDPKKSFDNFVALYVGAGQTLGPTWDGDMLYEHVQVAGKQFNTIDGNGEAHVNYDIRQYYQSLQQYLSEEEYCSREESIGTIWSLTNRIVARMYVPMVQMLIRSLKETEQHHKVKMYALGLIPQLSQCRPSVHRKLKTYLLDRDYKGYASDGGKDFGRILGLLQESYDCLGISCADVGKYVGDDGMVVAECAQFAVGYPMAGYVPKANVRTLSKADLDIHAISQLLKFPSKTKNKMAQLYYQYGRAAVIDSDSIDYDVLSLQEMALTNNKEKWSPYYQDYLEYHKEENFANRVILDSFEGVGKWGFIDEASRRNVRNLQFNPNNNNDDISNNPRATFLTSMMQYHLLPEYQMSLLGMSQSTCRDGTLDTYYWDSFAALYIGSMEGPQKGGSDETIDGYFLWNLANKRAVQFKTQNEDFYAIVNDEMIALLYAGQNQLSKFDCVNFEKTTSRVLHLMFVLLIQSCIGYAIRKEDESSGDSTDPDLLAMGETLAYSVLPVVAKYDPEVAVVIEKNMIGVKEGDPAAGGAQEVASAFYKVLKEIGWGCEYVGKAEGVDACRGYSVAKASSNGVDETRSISYFATWGVRVLTFCSTLWTLSDDWIL